MRNLRLLLVVLGVTLTVALALLRPLPSRADPAPTTPGPNPTSAENPPAPPPLPGVATPRHKRKKRVLTIRARRRLAAVRRAEHSLAVGRSVARYARHLLGVPYRYGGTSPRTGFDCSGFVRYVYSHFGISLAHSSFADMWRGKRVLAGHLEPGDLVFFDGGGHVGIYVGSGRFVHAPHTGTVVRISTMAGWYSQRFVEARRVR